MNSKTVVHDHIHKSVAFNTTAHPTQPVLGTCNLTVILRLWYIYMYIIMYTEWDCTRITDCKLTGDSHSHHIPLEVSTDGQLNGSGLQGTSSIIYCHFIAWSCIQKAVPLPCNSAELCQGRGAVCLIPSFKCQEIFTHNLRMPVALNSAPSFIQRTRHLAIKPVLNMHWGHLVK